MSFAWQRAHLQLLEEHALPVRTHQWRPPAPAWHRKLLGTPPAAITERRRQRIIEWLAKPAKTRPLMKEIAAELGISRVSVRKHVRAIEAER